MTQTSPAHGVLAKASVVIWTTTPWTLPGNRAISFSPKVAYGLYEVTDAPADNWAKPGDLLILADALADSVFKQARVATYKKVRDIPADTLDTIECAHPLRRFASDGYQFIVPLLPGDPSVTVDLQALLDRCYDAGPYRRRIRYADLTPQPPLRPDKPHPMWRGAQLDRALKMSDEEVTRTMSETTPPVEVPPRHAPAMAK